MLRRGHFLLALALLAVMATSGCTRYTANRLADFGDIFQAGVGVTAENPHSGVIPPSLGLHLQITEFVNLGALGFGGLVAEWDGRGLYAGPEIRRRSGLLTYQSIQIAQDYSVGYENYFKRETALWTRRMNSHAMRKYNAPAKELDYGFYNEEHYGYPLFHRGWQYWENIGLEIGISEPFLTHLGLHLRLGFDPSEISDFVLGFVLIDYKRDDLRPEEYEEMMGAKAARGEYKPAAQYPPQPQEAPMAQEAPAEEPVAEPMEVEVEPIPAPAPVETQVVWKKVPEMRTIYFDYDRANIRDDQVPRMQENLDFLVNNTDKKVRIVGHCDDRGSYEYNYKLGLDRAVSVRDWLVDNGISTARLSVESKGERDPAVVGEGDDVWEENRRVEFNEAVVIEIY